MSVQATRSARAVLRTRRIEAFKSSARLFASNRMGVAGLAILTVFVILALFADVLAPESRLSVTDAPGAPLEPPVRPRCVITFLEEPATSTACLNTGRESEP